MRLRGVDEGSEHVDVHVPHVRAHHPAVTYGVQTPLRYEDPSPTGPVPLVSPGRGNPE